MIFFHFIFVDGDDDLFSDPMLTDKQKTPIVENVMKKPAVTSSGGLFDDDDDDLFASVAPAKKGEIFFIKCTALF